MKWTDVMLDLETTGREPGCALIQIAAVPFNINTGEISLKTFKISINLEKQMTSGKGFTFCQNTYKWWMKENPALYKKLSTDKTFYVDAGRLFQEWFTSLENHKDIRVWGNGARFDIGILNGWYKTCIGPKFQPFWNTWLERDVRTLSSLKPEIKKNLAFLGTKHNALHDCRHQIRYCVKTMRALKLKMS